MNKKTNVNLRKLFFILITIFLVWSVGAKYITSHEFIHSQIFKHYGIKTETQIDYLRLKGVTRFINDDFFDKCDGFCKFSNELNDIIGYYFATFIYFICIIYLIKFIKKFLWK